MTTSGPYDAGVATPRGRVPPLPIVVDIPPIPPTVIETAPEPVIAAPMTAATDEMAELDLTRTRTVLQEWQKRQQAVTGEIDEQMAELQSLEGELLRTRRKILADEAKASATAPILARKAETEATVGELRARAALVEDELGAAQKAYEGAAQRRNAAVLTAEGQGLVSEAAESDALLDSLMAPLVAAANARAELVDKARDLARQIQRHNEDPRMAAKIPNFDASPTFLKWDRVPAAKSPRRFHFPG